MNHFYVDSFHRRLQREYLKSGLIPILVEHLTSAKSQSIRSAAWKALTTATITGLESREDSLSAIVNAPGGLEMLEEQLQMTVDSDAMCRAANLMMRISCIENQRQKLLDRSTLLDSLRRHLKSPHEGTQAAAAVAVANLLGRSEDGAFEPALFELLTRLLRGAADALMLLFPVKLDGVTVDWTSVSRSFFSPIFVKI